MNDPSRRRPERANTAHNWLLAEAGFSLVEELVAISLVAVGVILLLAMIGTGSAGVAEQRDRALAQGLARSQLELIKDSPYRADPTAIPYPNPTPPAGFSVQVNVEYWDASSGAFTPTMNSSGLQRITATVARSGDTLLNLEDLKVDR